LHQAIAGTVCLIALMLGGCSTGETTISRLEGAEPQRLSFGKPAEVQRVFALQMQSCWFEGPQPRLAGYQFDTKPALTETPSGQVALPQIRINAEPDEQSFVIQFFPFNNNTLISTRNLSMPAELASTLRQDIETWIFGEENCTATTGSPLLSSTARRAPQTSSAASGQTNPGGWDATAERAARSVNRY